MALAQWLVPLACAALLAFVGPKTESRRRFVTGLGILAACLCVTYEAAMHSSSYGSSTPLQEGLLDLRHRLDDLAEDLPPAFATTTYAADYLDEHPALRDRKDLPREVEIVDAVPSWVAQLTGIYPLQRRKGRPRLPAGPIQEALRRVELPAARAEPAPLRDSERDGGD